MANKASQDNYFDGDMGVVWVQPAGANTESFPIPCANLDAVDAPQGDTTTRMCKGADGRYLTVHRAQGTPGEATTTIETWLPRTRDYLQKQVARRCPMPIYLQHTHCGRLDTFLDYEHGERLANGIITSKGKGSQVRGMVDAGDGAADMATQSFDISGEPLPADYWPLVITDRSNIAEDEPLRDIWFSDDARCVGPCGTLQDDCERGSIAADAATGLSADVWTSVNGWATGAAVGTDPFGADENVASLVRFAMDRDTIRMIAIRGTTDGANPAEIGYTDYDIPTATWGAWTNVNLGATNGEYALHGGALFAFDAQHIWACTDQGNIFYSSDAGLTWTDQAAPTPVGGAEGLYCIRFLDYNYGVCVGGTTGASSVYLTTTDGGEHWALGTGAAAKILTGCDLVDSNRIWVCDEDGGLWYTNDFGANWTQRVLTSKTPDTMGDVVFINEFDGACCGNYSVGADDFGAIYRTYDGGEHWEAYVHGTALDGAIEYYGMNAIWMCDTNHIFAVGEIVNSVGLILELSAQGSV